MSDEENKGLELDEDEKELLNALNPRIEQETGKILINDVAFKASLNRIKNNVQDICILESEHFGFRVTLSSRHFNANQLLKIAHKSLDKLTKAKQVKVPLWLG